MLSLPEDACWDACNACQGPSPACLARGSRRPAAQDAVKQASRDELPDFYNIQLERPRDDPGGYDCLFVDAAAKAPLPSKPPRGPSHAHVPGHVPLHGMHHMRM